MPAIGIISAGIGAYQAISGEVKAHKNEKALEAQAKAFQPNQSLLDYYNKRIAAYSPNPYQSVAYGQQKNQINRNLATGINSLQQRRLGIGGIGSLVQQANDASGRAAGNAEQSNRADLSGLGQAAQMKTNEQQKKFDMMYNLTAAKAGAGAAMENSGISNLYGGLSNYAYLNKWDGSGDSFTKDAWWGHPDRLPRVARATF